MCYKESTQLKPGVVDIPITSSFKSQSTRLDYTAERKRERYDQGNKKTKRIKYWINDSSFRLLK